MRLFVAAAVPREVAEKLAPLADEGRHAKAPVKWVEGPHLHLTIQFLGEQPSDRLEAIVAALRQAALPQAFGVSLDGTGQFPPSGAPRVLWIGVGEGGEALARLAEIVGGALGPLGIAPEGRPYHAHVTLGRVRGGARNLADLHRIWSGYEAAHFAAWRIRELEVLSSALGPDGPEYHTLAKVALAG